MKKENSNKHTRHIIGSIQMSSPPKILPSYVSGESNIKPFMLKIHGDIQKSNGAFLVNNVQCKIVDGQLVPDIIIHENSKFFYNCNTTALSPGLIYIWSDKNKKWIDAATTTSIIQKHSEDRKKWLIFSKQLEKKYNYSKTESRRFFRNLKVSGVEELICCLNYLYDSVPSKAFVQQLLEVSCSKEDIENYLGFSCNNLISAKEAMKHYIEN